MREIPLTRDAVRCSICGVHIEDAPALVAGTIGRGRARRWVYRCFPHRYNRPQLADEFGVTAQPRSGGVQ